MTKNRLDSMLQGEILKQIEEQQATIRQLKEAIYWALGERDDFPIRYPGDGAFYWRTELRKRSGLPVNGITDEPFPLREETDAVDCEMEVCISSDTIEKVETARKAACDLLLNLPASHDIMVTVQALRREQSR